MRGFLLEKIKKEMELIMNTQCPECDAVVEIADDAIIGEIADCEECSAELEVTALEPLTVALAPEIEEDWGE